MLNECNASDASSDEHEPAETNPHDLLVDSIICNDECSDEDVNMHAVYLQSIKSPFKHPAPYRIPHPSKYQNVENIYSQDVLPDSFTYKDVS